MFLCLLALTPTHLPATSPLIGRASVIDGDTLEIQGRRVRLWGVDAPEGRQVCQRDGKDWRCGQAAALALADWIGQQTVVCREKDRDRYRRIVATCTVGGQDVAAWLVSEGWAMDYARYSKGAYKQPQEAARRAGRGIWSGPFTPPWEWRRGARR